MSSGPKESHTLHGTVSIEHLNDYVYIIRVTTEDALDQNLLQSEKRIPMRVTLDGDGD